MFALRLYVTALIVVFLLSTVMTTGVSVLHGIILVCAPLYTILDIREELQEISLLEARVASLSR